VTEFSLTLANGREVLISGDCNILEGARQKGIILDHSCLTGQCGVCSCNLVFGEVAKENDVFKALGKSNSQRILTCQSIPLTDLKIDIEDLGAYLEYPAKTYPARVSALTLLAEDVLKLTLRTPPSSRMRFLPGQYVELISGNIRRSYSIANAEREDGTIDLIVKKVHAGKMSEVLFENAKENDIFRLEGPLGTFGWRDPLPQNIVFLATGTGIAPVLSMLERFDCTNKSITIIWGNRYKNEFFPCPELEAKVRFLRVLSRDFAEGYFSGYVQDLLISLGLDFGDMKVYACGSDNMIQSSRLLLQERGLDFQNFHSDSFLSTGY
jgi:CDP-4-dehydro-6-deoxyglucose reductase